MEQWLIQMKCYANAFLYMLHVPPIILPWWWWWCRRYLSRSGVGSLGGEQGRMHSVKMMLHWQDRRHPTCSTRHCKGSVAQIHTCELSLRAQVQNEDAVSFNTIVRRSGCDSAVIFQFLDILTGTGIHFGLHTGPATTGNCQKGQRWHYTEKVCDSMVWHSNSVLIV